MKNALVDAILYMFGAIVIKRYPAEDMTRLNLLIKSCRKRFLYHFLALLLPVLLYLFRPLGLSRQQAFLSAALLLVIIWWCSGLVPKLWASVSLLAVFSCFGGTPLRTVFAFPLSETFGLLVLTYLFSRSVENTGLAERLLEPLLARWTGTPLRMVLAAILSLTAAIYVIPQPLARLVIIASIFRAFLEKTDIPSESRAFVLFSVFAFYLIVNMLLLDADLILNVSAVAFAGVPVTKGQWMRFMAPPTLLYLTAALGLLCIVFRGEMRGVRFRVLPTQSSGRLSLSSGRNRAATAVIAGTALCWIAAGLWEEMLPGFLGPAPVTLLSVLLLFALGNLRPRDLKVIDINTLAFLSAAFSIGGVLKGAGVADIVFTRLTAFFPSGDTFSYAVMAVLVSMGIHMLLGSSTTSLSVIIPGFLITAQGILPAQAVLFLCYTSLASHYIMPFHAVSIMVGASAGYFPLRYTVRFGLPLTLLLFFFLLFVYLPWWRFTGLFI